MNPIPLSIKIGITGHRKIKNPDEVKAKIEASINQILKDNQTNEFIAYTALAYGADTLFAQVAKEKYNAPIKAVIPFQKEEYEKDFDKPEFLTEFNKWYDELKPEELTQLKLIKDDEKKNDENRNDAYEAVGKHIVEKCDVMLAVWNGQPAGGKGGTTDIIDECLKKESLCILFLLSRGF